MFHQSKSRFWLRILYQMVIQIVAFVLPLAKSWTRLKPQIPEIVIWEKIEQSWLLSRCVLLPTSLVSEWYVIFPNLDSLLIIYYRTNKSEVLLFLKVKSLQLRNRPSSNFCKKHTPKNPFVCFEFESRSRSEANDLAPFWGDWS